MRKLIEAQVNYLETQDQVEDESNENTSLSSIRLLGSKALKKGRFKEKQLLPSSFIQAIINKEK